jgi:hypothetical protein
MQRLLVATGYCCLMLLAGVACSTSSDKEDVNINPDVKITDLVDVATEVDEDLYKPPQDAEPELDIITFDFVDNIESDLPDVEKDLPTEIEEVPDVAEVELPPPTPTDVGKECLTDSDCETDAGCLLGFCTAFCKSGGQPIAGACEYPSLESAWGEVFSCPADMNLCMPGNVDGKVLTCKVDTDCAEAGLPGFVCAGAFTATEVEVAGRCLPLLNRKPAGASCLESGSKCSSLICLHPELDASLNGICTAYCDDSTACPEDTVCSMHPVFEDDGELMGYAPLCAPLKGSLKECADDPGICKFGKEYCGAVFSPGTYEADFRCVETKFQYGGWTGEPCDPNSPCFTDWCVFGDWSNKVDSYCSIACNDDSDCAAGMSCREVHVAPYEGVLPYGVFEVGVCLRDEAGSPCFTSETDVCQYEWSFCEALPGIFGLGTCVDGECPPACGGKSCQADDGCGNPCLDACKGPGEFCGAAEECLSGLCVDGVCCDMGCEGSCEACNIEGAVGMCTAYLAGIDPEAECEVCNACDGNGACAPFGEGEDPGNGCGVCQVCGAEGACVPVAFGEDPTLECGICSVCSGEGACAPAFYGEDPKEECAEEESATCLTTGICNGEGACEFWAEETVCSDASCNGNNYLAPGGCNGKGTCVPAAPFSCLPFICDAESALCLDGCDDAQQCAPGNWCVDGACELLPACPVETKLICNTQLPGSTIGLANDWSDYGCVPGVGYNGPDRIYSVKMDQAMRITLTLKEAQFDSAMMLIKDACAPGLSCVGFADLFPSGGEETINFDAEAGVQYHLAVDGFAADDHGTYQLQSECCQIQCAGENACGSDGCGGSCGSCGDGEVCSLGQCQECGDDPGGEPNENCQSAIPLFAGVNEGFLLCPTGDVDWFSFDMEPGQTATLLLEFEEDLANLDMALYGPDCNQFLLDSTTPDSEEAIEFMATKSGTYYILVYAPLGEETGYNLLVDVEDPECFDDGDCPNPMEVCGQYECVVPPPACSTTGEPVCDAFIAGSTSGKVMEMSTYASCTEAVLEGPEDRYKLTFPQDTVATITLSGHAFVAGVTVLEQYCAADWACVTANVGKVKGEPVTVIFNAKAGTLYYLIVDGKTIDDHGTYSFDVDCCLPQCGGKVCGDDGCGLSCGTCPGDQDACVDGACVCQPSCDGKVCGGDGCGGGCGDCLGEQDACEDGQCVCQPSCDGKACGDDGCGGEDCGICEGPQDACIEHQCVCQPMCDGMVCGDDGCGGSCGECPGPQDACEAGACVCQPTCEGKQCGDDGCGGDCGGCEGPQELCEDFQCVCQPDCDGKNCGDDGCGGVCGECGAVESCQDFQCLCSDDFGYEPNDQCSKATMLEEGSYPNLGLCTDDEDWYKIFLPANSTLQATILFNHSVGDLDLYLYKQGDCLTPKDSSASSSDNEGVVFSTETSATYLIRVAGFTKQVSNSYTLSLTIK